MRLPLILTLLAMCALVACKNDPPPAPAQPKKAAAPEFPEIAPDTDIENALNLMYGTAVVYRGGENDLENSPAHAIDGFLDTTWTSAPGSPEETIIYSFLGARRIERVGAVLVKSAPLEGVIFDTSMDGKTWHELAKLKLQPLNTQQQMSVPPTDARYLRVRTIDSRGHYYVRVRAFQAMGAEIEAPRTPPFTGCWTINGNAAHIAQNGARITGVIAADPPIFLDGGTADNRMGTVMWMQGPARGDAILTRSADGKHITGLTFYEDIDSSNIGEAWYGERCNGAPKMDGPAAAPATFLDRKKRYSVYGLAFHDDQLIPDLSASALDTLATLIQSAPQRVSIVAHELRYAAPAENKQHANVRLQAIRAALQARGVDPAKIDFVAAGSDQNGSSVTSALQQAALSRLDLRFGR